jgi:hypothetical protein
MNRAVHRNRTNTGVRVIYTGNRTSVAATRLKVGLEAEVGHMMGPVTLQFLMEKPVDSVTTRLKVGT